MIDPQAAPLPLPDDGNGERRRTLVYDAADAPMIARALSVGATTAMMCDGRESMRRLRHYRGVVAAEAHPASRLMRRETDLCEIAIIASAVPSWTIHRVREREWSREFRVVVTVGTRRFGSRDLVGDDVLEAIAAMVADTVPLPCVRAEADDAVGSPWSI